MDPSRPLVAIVGPTASGKTALGIDLAKRHNGEIICADSRTIYKGMDIGTAKPSFQEQDEVPHWGLDLVEPDTRFTVADFKSYADQAIADIRGRGKLPIIVGGTGLYVDSVVYNFMFSDDYDKTKREQLEKMAKTELIMWCKDNNIKLPENVQNKRYIIRAIERGGASNTFSYSLPDNTIVVGIATNMDNLRVRITERSEHIFKNGVVEEATILGKKYGWNSEAMTGNVYRLCKKLSANEASLSEVKAEFITSDYRLAKRQMTWLRRNPTIMWAARNEALDVIEQRLVC